VRGAVGGQFPTMTPSLPLVQGPAAVDTVVMRLLPPEPSWFAQAVSIASGILTLVACLLLIGVVLLAIRQRKVAAERRSTLVTLSRDLAELLAAAKHISQEIATISSSVRSDVAELHDTVAYTNRRARRTVAALADRVDLFTETVAVVQEEAQDVIVNGLAAVRGVRAGVRAAVRGPETDADEVDAEPRPRRRRRVREAGSAAEPTGPHLRRHRRVD
jgi:hypothetical protein